MDTTDTQDGLRISSANIIGGDVLLEYADGSSAIFPAALLERVRPEAILVVGKDQKDAD